MSGNEAVNVRAGRHTGGWRERELTLKNELNLFVGLPQLWLPLGQSWLTLCLPASNWLPRPTAVSHQFAANIYFICSHYSFANNMFMGERLALPPLELPR